MRVALGEVAMRTVALASILLHLTLSVLVQIELQGIAHVVVYAGGGVGCHQLLALGNHREDAAVHGGGARIDGHILGLEDFGKVLSHASANAVVLSLAHGGQVAQPLVGGLIEQF